MVEFMAVAIYGALIVSAISALVVAVAVDSPLSDRRRCRGYRR